MKFQFRPVLSVCALAGLAVLLTLGTWQLQRLEWKRDLIAKSTARVDSVPISLDTLVSSLAESVDQEYQPVFLVGSYDHAREERVFGTLDGKPGYYIFTPLLINYADTDQFYINRGFVPQKIWQNEQEKISRPEGNLDIAGLFRAQEVRRGLSKKIAPPNQVEDRLWFERRPDLMAAGSARTTFDGYLDMVGETEGQWPKSGVTRLDFSNRHLEYAMTWYGLALTLVGVWFAFSRRKN